MRFELNNYKPKDRCIHNYFLRKKTMQPCAQTIRRVFKVYIYIHVYKGKCLQFSAGDDGVPRRNGLEPVSQKKRISSINTSKIFQYLHK